MDISLQTLAAAILKNKQTLKTYASPPMPVPSENPAMDPSDQKVTIYLIKTPLSGMKGLLRIRQNLALELSIGNLLSNGQQLPLCLLENVSFSQYSQRCTEILEAEDCIEVIEVATGKRIYPVPDQDILTDHSG